MRPKRDAAPSPAGMMLLVAHLPRGPSGREAVGWVLRLGLTLSPARASVAFVVNCRPTTRTHLAQLLGEGDLIGACLNGSILVLCDLSADVTNSINLKRKTR